VPFFLTFVALSRVVALAEGRLIEAMTGIRMPRRPVYQGTALGFWPRIGQMLKDWRTWSTLAYFLSMLPIGIIYFVIALVGLTVSLTFMFMPVAVTLSRFGVFGPGAVEVFSNAEPAILWSTPLAFFLMGAGLLLLTSLMHLARGIGRLHALYAKSLLVARTAPAVVEQPPLAVAAH
jgi:hypothetical protein